MFTREWIEGELTRLIIQLHQTEGMISMLRQMFQALEQAESHGLPLDDLIEKVMPGATIEGIVPIEGISDED